MSKSRPSKQDVTNALGKILDLAEHEYREYGADGLGWFHSSLALDGVTTHAPGKTVYEARRALIAWAGRFRSKAKPSTSVRRQRIKALAKIERAIAKGGGRDV
jgi:hypothetical protein